MSELAYEIVQAKIKAAKELVERLEAEAEHIVEFCDSRRPLAALPVEAHIWAEIQYEPVRHEGYHIAGDPPGTMGVDRQLPMDVPAETISRWSRRCVKCGYVQLTEQKKMELGADGLRHEVPNFAHL